jgi:hypothetical protein
MSKPSWSSTFPEDERRRLIHHLRRDGYQVVDDRISSGPASEVADIPLGTLTDPAVIEDHLNRIRDAIDSDPNLAIGSAKELIESTAKLVITEMGQTYSSGDDLPALVRKAQRALKLDADAIAPDARGADTIPRILSSLSQVAIGVAELRNLYGDRPRPGPPNPPASGPVMHGSPSALLVCTAICSLTRSQPTGIDSDAP